MPVKCRSRKPRRSHKPTPADHELVELATVLAEYTLDNNAGNWFKLPWRNGWNAVELAVRVAEFDQGDIEDAWLLDACMHRRVDPEIYWSAQDRLSSTVTPNRTMRAALRCLQVLVSHSDGGGEVYNAILVNPIATLQPEQVSDLVLEYRCRDSIGVSAELAGDGNDRLRRAFTIAWQRGLYMAAYSLPPATVVGQLSLKVIK